MFVAAPSFTRRGRSLTKGILENATKYQINATNALAFENDGHKILSKLVHLKPHQSKLPVPQCRKYNTN